MRILIGSSSSAGSSLLKNILSRHTAIFAGGETSLFCKKELFLNFDANKNRILKRFPLGLKNYGYHLYNGVDLVDKEYGHSKLTIRELINQSHSLQEFADSFFKKELEKSKKEHWLEKTPANAYLFPKFLETVDDSIVIHIVRNPYDTMFSLLKRGHNIIYAIGIYLLNTSAALKAKDHSSYIQVKYESLVSDPKATIQKLCAKLNITYEPSMLEKGNPYQIITTKIDSWKYDETGEIKEGSIGSFEKASEPLRSLIHGAMKRIKVSPHGEKYYELGTTKISDLCNLLDYHYLNASITKDYDSYFIKTMRKDKWYRTIKGYPTGLLNYPLELI